MDLWRVWPTNQTKERISISDKQEAPSKLTEAQKEMVTRIREMDKKQKDFDLISSISSILHRLTNIALIIDGFYKALKDVIKF
jgi:hypothetical protein